MTNLLTRKLNYTYTTKNCNVHSCTLIIDFNPEAQAPIIFQNLIIYLPHNYKIINASIPGLKYNAIYNPNGFYTEFMFYNYSTNISGPLIEYFHPSTNYVNIVSDILYQNKSLDIILNMSN